MKTNTHLPSKQNSKTVLFHICLKALVEIRLLHSGKHPASLKKIRVWYNSWRTDSWIVNVQSYQFLFS